MPIFINARRIVFSLIYVVLQLTLKQKKTAKWLSFSISKSQQALIIWFVNVRL